MGLATYLLVATMLCMLKLWHFIFFIVVVASVHGL